MRIVTLGIAVVILPAFALAASVGDSISVPEAKGVVDVVLQHGITGAMLLIVLWMYFRKDKQLADEQEKKDKAIAAANALTSAESAARVADAKASTEVMRSLVVATTTQMERFNDTAEALVNELRTERHAHVVPHPAPRPVGR